MKSENPNVIFSDGSSRGNPGPGGWGAIVALGRDRVVELGGKEDKTTNNRMELSALLGAFEFLSHEKQIGKVLIFTDSAYAVNGITKWVLGWEQYGWKTKDKKDVMNKDLWEKLRAFTKQLQISWNIVKGHGGIKANERCDEIATSFADKAEIRLFDGAYGDYKIPVTPPSATEMEEAKGNDRRKAKAYSYLSLVDGVFMRHTTWDECKNRVNGKVGARFRKAISEEDEADIKAEWGVNA